MGERRLVYEVVVVGGAGYRVFSRPPDPAALDACAAGRHASTMLLLVEGAGDADSFWWCACGRRRATGLGEPGDVVAVPADDHSRWLADARGGAAG